MYVNCTVNMGYTVSEKSVSPTNFGRGRFQGNFSHLKNITGYRRFYLFDII